MSGFMRNTCMKIKEENVVGFRKRQQFYQVNQVHWFVENVFAAENVFLHTNEGKMTNNARDR